MSAYAGANAGRLNGDWQAWLTHPDNDYATDALTINARGWDLWRNDPVARAIVKCETLLTHGSEGLRRHSLATKDGDDTTSPDELAERQEIDAATDLSWENRGVDASGLMTRYQLEVALDTAAKVGGDCFGIRCWKPNRNTPFATCWRLIRGEYISNPGYQPDSGKFYRGIEFDDDEQPVAIHVQHLIRSGVTWLAADWTRVPWSAADGMPGVIFRRGDCVPGGIRGISIFAPALVSLRQVFATNEAYVVGKRTQASHPIIKKVLDPQAAAKADRAKSKNGNSTIQALTTLYVGQDQDIILPSWQFNGADTRDFLNTQYRSICASRGLPWEFVLAQLTDANLAAARAAMLQAYRTATAMQNDHISEVTSVIDESLIREAAARGAQIDAENPARFMRCEYHRPPRAMPDPAKEATAAQLWLEMGCDYDSLFAESGRDFETCVRRRAQNEKFLASQGVKLVPVDPKPTPPEMIEQPTKPAPAQP